MPQSVREEVFVSYSHKDKKWLDEVLTHLKPYLRSSSITVWSDRQIQPGSKWLKEIQLALARTKVAVLLPLARMRQTRDDAWVRICKAIEDATGELRVVSRPDQRHGSKLLRDLERSIACGMLRRSRIVILVHRTLQKERRLKVAESYSRARLIAGIMLSDEYRKRTVKGAGRRDWQQDFATVATPALVAVAHSLDRSASAQAIVLELCDGLAAALRLRLTWPANPEEANDLKNAIYTACLDATTFESDDVVVELKKLRVVGPT